MNKNEQKNRDDQDRNQNADNVRLFLGANDGPFLPFRGVRREDRDDVVDAAGDAAVEIAGFEARRDGVDDDDFRRRVSQRSFEPIADFDADLVLLRRHQEEHAIVLLLLAELPSAEKLIRVRFDLQAFERGDGGDDKLDAGLVLQVLELGRQRASRIRRKDIGLVDHPTA